MDNHILINENMMKFVLIAIFNIVINDNITVAAHYDIFPQGNI